MDFSTFIAPLAPSEFDRRYWNQEPVVIRGGADADRAHLLKWARLNALLQIRAHWTVDRMKMVLNSAPIDPDFYMEDVAGRRLASPARVDVLMGVGATLVADMVEEIDPDIGILIATLADRFAGRAGANVYASFQGVQAFASHCDLHEVFAIQCEGAKRWRVYGNRADNPIEMLEGPAAQAQIDAAKGPVIMDVTTEPGDLIYIPRGFFHDAVATEAASLHVTIGVAPAWGTLALNFLDDLARREPLFRNYLPDARVNEGADLKNALEALASRLAELVRSRGSVERVKQWQRRFHKPVFSPRLPDRPKPTQLNRSGVFAELSDGPDGSAIRLASGEVLEVGCLSDVVHYIFSRPAVLIEEILARFDHHPKYELDDLLARMQNVGLLRRD